MDKSLPASKKAFTLVELIVVITILAILGTIGFLSLGGYSSSSRDSNRAASLSLLAKSLDAFMVTAGSYPNPSSSFSVAYSGWVIWKQWTVGDSVIAVLWAGGASISKKPVDPLTQAEYQYSVSTSPSAYAIKADYEWSVAFSAVLPVVSADNGQPANVFMRTNYGGVMLKTFTGSYWYVIASPSIMAGQSGASGSILDISSINKMIVQGKTSSGISFTPNVAYSGTTIGGDSASVSTLMSNLQGIYGSTEASSSQAVASLLSIPAGQLASMGAPLVQTQLGIQTTVTGSTATFSSCIFWSSTIGNCGL